jgi:signal transduction histidine kinase
MTIKRRILIGHFAVAGLLLVPAVYAAGSLWQVARASRQSLDAGMARLDDLDRLRAGFDQLDDLRKLSSPLRELSSPRGNDAPLSGKLDRFLRGLSKSYEKVRLQILGLGMSREVEHLDMLFASTPHGPGVRPEPAAILPWSEGDIAQARNELKDASDEAVRRMFDETREAESRAWGAASISLACLAVAAALAVLSTILTLRGMRRPMERLLTATLAVSAGRFGIAVPEGGGDDDLSRLTEAFNKMSQNLALFETMKADFLSIAAHELRTPLTCIKGYVGALRATLPPEAVEEERVARYLDRIDQEADLMTAQVSELLTLGMIEAGQLRLDLSEVPSEGFLIMVAESFKPIAAERGIDFRTELEGLPRQFVGDRSRLNQVILNLLDNAFKYTPAGGRVVLQGRAREDMIEFEVRDTCGGIPADQLEVIFEKYTRVRSGASRGKQGTGLGLAVARGIVAAHGGTIEAASEPGKGCRFTVRLPVRGAAGKPRTTKEEVA